MSCDTVNNTKTVNENSGTMWVTSRSDMNKTLCDKNKKLDANSNSGSVIKVKSVIPKRRQELLKWYGWGYKDSMFKVDESGATFTGDRYAIAGKNLPYILPWVAETFAIDLTKQPKEPTMPTSFPKSRLPDNIRKELEEIAEVSTDGMDRLIRAHGQTLKDIVYLRSNKFPRIPDAVIWPESHDQVEAIVQCACRHRFVIIPFGGGTSVSGAATCPAREPRPVLALDTSQMNSILWLDKEQLLARVQAGAVGQDLERALRARGLTAGHEPDSHEFSSLGGWLATRASGMKKNSYGNIEDLVVHVKMVTPRGVIEKGCRVPRLSSGPDFDHVIMGSEGCFGVVTEVTLKVRPLPPVVRYGSLVFPAWEQGVQFAREVARRRLQPASIRLMDNDQFRFGLALKPEASWGGVLLDGLKRAYLTRVRGFRPERLAVATLLLEGAAGAVREQQRRLTALAARFGGVPAGAANGERGYTLTFVIAYIRDLALQYDIVSESFETSVAWDRAPALCHNVKRAVRAQCAARRLLHYHISCRLTQTYDAGCCLYFYFAFNSAACADPVAEYESIEEAARDEILASGGSISHHHGVGKLRKKWYTDTVSKAGRALLWAAKRALDPLDVFALGNLAFPEGPPRGEGEGEGPPGGEGERGVQKSLVLSKL